MSRLVPILLVILIHACDPPVQKQESPVEDLYHEQFVRTNRYMQMRHQDQIAAFLELRGATKLDHDSRYLDGHNRLQP